MMDPQQRHFLECSWEALEDAGYDPRTFAGSIGVFGGVNISSYLFNNLSDYDAVGAMSDFHTRADILIGNQPDFLTSRVSYALGLGGPSISIQTSCSSALVAVHTACQHLLRHECDMALAGGVQMRVPQRMGYLYREGGLPSPDGHCRSFDAAAKGTVHGNGCGLVVLKRLADALRDGDHVYGVVKGSSVNNDAGTSVGYTAPSAEGLTRVATEALAVAGVEPASVGLVEANGTGTEMGDPIEFTALARAYRSGGDEAAAGAGSNHCALGSVKTNIGHLDTASGIASLIKAVLAVRQGEIPALLHFQSPNANIDLESSPFYVNTERVPWPAALSPRRAAVNNFGVGGTNAHAVVEEPPALDSEPSRRPVQLLPLSARTTSALHRATSRLRGALAGDDGFDRRIDHLADVAFTLQTGRRHFAVRRLVVARDLADAGDALGSLDPQRVETRFQTPRDLALVLAFPGEADLAALVDLARRAYPVEPTFRAALDEAAAALVAAGVEEPLARLLGDVDSERRDGADRAAAAATQDAGVRDAGVRDALALAVQVGLAALLSDWGVRPAAVVSHGAGHAAAALFAGVLPLAAAVEVALARGRGERAALTAALAAAEAGTPSLPWSTASGPFDASRAADADWWSAAAGAAGAPAAALASLPAAGEADRLLLVLGDEAGAAAFGVAAAAPAGRHPATARSQASVRSPATARFLATAPPRPAPTPRGRSRRWPRGAVRPIRWRRCCAPSAACGWPGSRSTGGRSTPSSAAAGCRCRPTPSSTSASGASRSRRRRWRGRRSTTSSSSTTGSTPPPGGAASSRPRARRRTPAAGCCSTTAARSGMRRRRGWPAVRQPADRQRENRRSRRPAKRSARGWTRRPGGLPGL